VVPLWPFLLLGCCSQSASCEVITAAEKPRNLLET
jgi:hypothetical protein